MPALALLAAAALPAADLRAGAAAVAEQTSAQPAIRAAGTPSPGFAAGAALRAWANAAAAAAFDAAHTTGDGGDAEALAVDCTDERMTFAELERRAHSSGFSPTAIVAGAGLADSLAAAWARRRTAVPTVCR